MLRNVNRKAPRSKTPARSRYAGLFNSCIELLEQRQLLSATIQPDLVRIQPAATGPTTIQGYTPSQIQQAYNFNQVSFSNSSIKADGAGQTIAIVTRTTIRISRRTLPFLIPNSEFRRRRASGW